MRRNTKQFLIAELLNQGMKRREVYENLRPMVENQQRPMIFSANVAGKRVPKPLGRQLIELRYEINRVAQKLNVDDGQDFNPADIDSDSDNIVDDVSNSDSEPDVSDETEIEIDETPDAAEVKPIASGKVKVAVQKSNFLAEVRRIRQFCKQREISGETIDSISMRPIEAGARLIPVGIPGEALLAAMTLHWPQEALQSASIPTFDFAKLSREIMANRGISEITRSDGTTETPHVLFGYVLTLIENKQPTMAIGPAGTGKSFLGRQVADFLGMNYAECPITPGASRGDLLGRHTIRDFISAEFVNIYSGGGIFNFEEIDAGDPGMLLVLNNALSSNSLYNPVNGEQYDRHSEFVPYSTANTYGLGANRSYTGREKLDAATIDRWRMGRIFLEIDENVENSILA
jgi:hypothetical protein